jgi:Na+/H+ antiporter NhaC
VAASVGASVTTVVGASVGAAVAGAQAETTSTRIAITAKSELTDFFISSPLENWDMGNVPTR